MLRTLAAPVLRAVGCAVVVSGASLSVPAIAAETLAIEEIIVTARKKEESAQDVPVAMTALARELQDSTVRNLADLTGYAPNVLIRANSGVGARASQITIRGVTGTNAGEKSFDSPIAVSLDGVFFGTDSGRIIENFDLERVEVLRGPQGTLFGKNTVGGVINVYRSRPTGEIGGKARVTAGRYGQQEIRALLNFPVTESLAAKIFYSGIQGDGHLDREFDDGDAPKKDYENFGISLLWEPNDQFDALLTVERYNDYSDIGAPTNFNVGPGYFDAPTDGFSADFSLGSVPCNTFGECRTDPDSTADSVATERPNNGRYRNDVYALNMNYDLNDNLSLVSVTAYHDTPYEDSESQLDGVSVDNIIINNDNSYDQFTQELRLEGSYERFDFVVGGYYLDSTYDQDWVTEGNFWQLLLGPLGDGMAFDPGTVAACAAGAFGQLLCDPASVAAGEALGANFDQRLYQTQDTESIAFFGQVDYEITDKLVGTAGIRYTDEDKDFLGYQSYLGSIARRYPFNFDVPAADLSNSWQETIFKFGLAYHYTDEMMFFASYSEGFKSGGFFGVNQNVSDFVRNQYDPENAKSYEVGMKSQLMDNRLQLNVAGFYNDFKGKQDSNVVVDDTTASVATVFENIGSLEYSGIEVEVRFVATENLDLFATGGWLDARYDEFFSLSFIPIADRTPDSVPVDVSDLEPKLAPEWTFGAGGTYTQQVGPGDLSIHAKWNYYSEQETDTGNDPGSQVPSQNFINAQIGYEWDNIRLTLFGENLTDEVNEFAGCLASAVPGVAFFCTGNVDQGRTWGIELEVAFGN